VSWHLLGDERLGRSRNISQQLGRGFEIPIGIGDIGVAQVRRESDKVSRDGVTSCCALFQGSCGEGVPFMPTSA
jgi:hypothetical protein